METPQPHYSVIAEAHPPLFESERLFVMHEKAHVEEQLSKLAAKPRLVTALLPVLGELKPQDWKDYWQALEHYAAKMDEHEQKMAEGLVPVKFFVVNLQDNDEAIKIRLHVDGGTVHPAQTAPVRPTRIDGPQHAPDWTPTAAPRLSTIVSGFSRSKVKIGKHTIEAEFSRLEGQDSADVVHQVLYIHGNDNTRFTYEITSKQVRQAERGNVTVA